MKLRVVHDDDGSTFAVPRPEVRADCMPGGVNGMRPCPWYSCRWHTGAHVVPGRAGGAKAEIAIDPDDLEAAPYSCVLDATAVNEQGITLDEVAESMGMSKERARQIEAQAVRNFKNRANLRNV